MVAHSSNPNTQDKVTSSRSARALWDSQEPHNPPSTWEVSIRNSRPSAATWEVWSQPELQENLSPQKWGGEGGDKRAADT